MAWKYNRQKNKLAIKLTRQGVFATAKRAKARQFFPYSSYDDVESTRAAAYKFLIEESDKKEALRNGTLLSNGCLFVKVSDTKHRHFIACISAEDCKAFKKSFWLWSKRRRALYRWYHTRKLPKHIDVKFIFKDEKVALQTLKDFMSTRDQLNVSTAFRKLKQRLEDKKLVQKTFSRWIAAKYTFIF
jgi:hypothetical protein